jgi:hypothetical protein
MREQSLRIARVICTLTPDSGFLDGRGPVDLNTASQTAPAHVALTPAAQEVPQRISLLFPDLGEMLTAFHDGDVAEGALRLAITRRGPVVPQAPGGFDQRFPRLDLDLHSERLNADPGRLS